MSADTIRKLLFAPSIAVARLGGSTNPMDALDWAAGDPHTIAETRIRPTWTLDVDASGRVTVRRPTELAVRDGALHRPVAPFWNRGRWRATVHRVMGVAADHHFAAGSQRASGIRYHVHRERDEPQGRLP